MIFERELLDRLAAYAPVQFDGDVFRATRRGLDPLAPSVAGGRWMIPDRSPTLYTSCERDGALAEIAYHWSQLVPPPSKPVVLHTLGLSTRNSLRLGRADLLGLGVYWTTFQTGPTDRTRAIGAAVAYLEYDGLIALSARWSCENVMLFLENHHGQDVDLAVRGSVDVDWQAWQRQHQAAPEPP